VKSQKLHFTTRGLVAVTVLAAIYGLTAVLARFLASGLGVFEQWYLRYGIGFVFAAVIFRKQISYRKFLRLPRGEWLLLVFRSIIGTVLAVSLYTLASEKAKIGPVAFMQVLPSPALFGVLLLHEKISWQRAALVVTSFLGAAVVAVNSFHDLAGFNIGEMYSLVSGVLFGLFLVTRKWHSDLLNNYELTMAIAGLGFAMDYVLSLVLYRRAIIPASRWTMSFALVLLAAGLLVTVIQFLINYGFEHVSAVVAGNVLSLEQIFGELLDGREIAGGLIILASVILMNQLARREHQAAQIAAAPD
jgi:drug/metabolite transporter (DMT)-like permease